MTVGQALERAEELRPGSRVSVHPAGVAAGSRRHAAGTLFQGQ